MLSQVHFLTKHYQIHMFCRYKCCFDSIFSVILHGWRPNKKCIKFTNIYRFLR